MSQESTYNRGRYDLQQQTFCMSMLTCLSFNLTGLTAASVTSKFRTRLTSVLEREDAQALLGKWNLIWGPVVYADSFVGTKTTVNSLFIVSPEEHPEQAIIAIAGTSGTSLIGWMVEDFNVKEKVPWPYGETSLNPQISKGIAFGLSKLLALTYDDGKGGGARTARDFLAANPSLTQLMVTGHSLGGALGAAFSLYLENTRPEWNRDGAAAISCLATAGQTPGDKDFSQFYGELLGANTVRAWHAFDIVPHAFQQEMLLQIPTLYESYLPPVKSVDKFIHNLRAATANDEYTHILPEVGPFPSSFIRIEDLAGDKYKALIDLIEHSAKLVKGLRFLGIPDAVGLVEFVGNGLVQHIFSYVNHFGVDDFIKIMCVPAGSGSNAHK